MGLIDRQLRYFLVIAELESLSKAAAALDQTQSGLSKQLATLEAHMGQALFTRTGRGLKLTEAGELLRDAASKGYREVDAAVEAVRMRGVTYGTVRLAAVHTMSYYYVRDLVTALMAQHPLVNLSLMGRSSPDVVSLVESGRADLGIVYDSAVDSGLVEATYLFDDEMSLILKADDERSGEQDLTLRELRMVAFPPQYALRRMIHSASLNPIIAAEAETIDVILQLVSSGLGDAILPSKLPEKMLEDHGLKKLPIARPLLKRKVVLIIRVDRGKTPLLSTVTDVASQLAKQL